MLNSRTWMLKKSSHTIADSEVTINLTNMEFAVIKLFTQNPAEPLKNDTIISQLEKCLDNYKGLCMCISRLNKKFKKATDGDRIFISVRNRGYKIKQKIAMHQ
jgi:DNA-binding winged helix-turn-helix (wHTH) protein